MAHGKDIELKLRKHYIQGYSLRAAATFAKVSYETARNWKRKYKADGDDWDIARSAKVLSNDSAEKFTAAVLEDFIILFQSTMEEIKNEQIKPVEKAETLSRLSDAYIKTVKAAGQHNPVLNQLSVAMGVIQDFGEFVRKNKPDLLVVFLELLEPFGAEIARKYGS